MLEDKIKDVIEDDRFKKMMDSSFDMGRIRAIINEMDPEDNLGLVQDHKEISKIWSISLQLEDDEKEDFVRNIIKIMHVDCYATVDSILKDLSLKDLKRTSK